MADTDELSKDQKKPNETVDPLKDQQEAWRLSRLKVSMFVTLSVVLRRKLP